MNFQQPVYDLYRRAGSALMRVAANRPMPASVRSMTDRIDALIRRLLNRKLPTEYAFDKFTLEFPGEGYFGLEIAAGQYEPKTTRVFKSLLRPGVNVADVGAHVGYYAHVAASTLGAAGRIYAFEPDPVTFAFLQKNIARNGFGACVTATNQIVSSATGLAQLFIGRRDRVANSIYAGAGVSGISVACESTTLDDFFRREGWPPVHVIKIDVEGAEHAVLQGMRELSARNADLKLVIEFFPSNLLAAGVQPEQFFATLRELGFTKVSVALDTPELLELPQDLPRLLSQCGPAFVNLLCEKA